jgi:hypothetical protein
MYQRCKRALTTMWRHQHVTDNHDTTMMQRLPNSDCCPLKDQSRFAPKGTATGISPQTQARCNGDEPCENLPSPPPAL